MIVRASNDGAIVNVQADGQCEEPSIATAHRGLGKGSSRDDGMTRWRSSRGGTGTRNRLQDKATSS